MQGQREKKLCNPGLPQFASCQARLCRSDQDSGHLEYEIYCNEEFFKIESYQELSNVQ